MSDDHEDLQNLKKAFDKGFISKNKYEKNKKELIKQELEWKEDFSGKQRDQVNEQAAAKRWSQAKNIGKGDNVPEGWALCNIGPKNAFVGLTDEVVKKYKIERDGLISSENLKEFWTGVCSFIEPEEYKYILSNAKAYEDFLIRGALLYPEINESYLKTFIEKNLNNKITKWRLKKPGMFDLNLKPFF